MRYFNAISTFTGSMGLDLGLETVGKLINDDLGPINSRFVIRACIESNETCRKTIIQKMENSKKEKEKRNG